MALDLSKLNELDFKNVGNWPVAGRAAVIAVLCLLVLVVGYVAHIQGLLGELSTAEQREISLRQDFEDKQSKAASRDDYQQQMKDMEESFGTMLRQLPSKTEVAELLVDVTQSGLAAGLTFDLFKPEKEVPLEFYAEMPIALEVSGTYHNFGAFVSGVAGLPRIVTLHDITIKPAQSKTRGALVMTAMAKTYRYLDDDEIAAAKALEKERAKGKKSK